MELRGFFATVFVFLFNVEVYSRPSDSRSWSFSYINDDGSGCTNNGDRYMRINTGKCENKNSRMECPAMADGQTSTDYNTNFKIVHENSTSEKRGNKSCISFNNTYSLMVQGNKVSFVNVSCEEGKNVWFKFKRLPDHSGRHHGFFIRDSTMCLTRSCDGTLSLKKVNSTEDRNCFFRQNKLDDKLMRQN